MTTFEDGYLRIVKGPFTGESQEIRDFWMRETFLHTRVGFVLKYCIKQSTPCFLEPVFGQELEKPGFRVVRGRQVGEKVLSWCHASTFFQQFSETGTMLIL